MIILLPSPRGNFGVPILPSECGYLITPSNRLGRGNQDCLTGYRWAADNECFTMGDRFDFPRYLRFLERAKAFPGECLFATVPDVVADHAATVDRWNQYAPAMRGVGLPLAFVAQDGMTALPDTDFDCLFIGGSTEWKLGQVATRLIADAKRAGKWVHMGRVNTKKRMRHAHKVCVDSVDGTTWAIAPMREIRWALPELRALNGQMRMFHDPT